MIQVTIHVCVVTVVPLKSLMIVPIIASYMYIASYVLMSTIELAVLHIS